MKKTINKSEFMDAFDDMGRGNRFSFAALRALFDYLEEYEEATGESVELDVVALCCDYTEYSDWKSLADEYQSDKIKTLEDLKDHTTVIEIPEGGFLIQNF